MRRYLRFLLVLLHVLVGIVWLRGVTLIDTLRGRTAAEGAARRACGRWSARLCRILGIRLRVEGAELVPGAVLLAGNHISWLDIPVIASVWPVAFLSKAEVSRWPALGPVVVAVGTLFIERGGRDAAGEASAAMRDRLLLGDKVLFFPEGTTSDGSALLPFRPRLFQAAVDAQAPVQSFAISYHNPDGTLSQEAPFIGDDTLLAHLLRVAGAGPLEARLRLSPPLSVHELGRTVLARQSRDAVLALRGEGAQPEPA